MFLMEMLVACIFCSISYKTQIVGGVVHRIPITAGAVIEVSLCHKWWECSVGERFEFSQILW